ncbi:hypothetical protein OQA88_1656 [Cercophora sp. LCS_1]
MGLAAAKNKRKLGNDPNNTKWSRNTDTFGQRMLRAQGWEPGQYLGAKDAAHAEWHTEASSSHIRVVLKDDNLGLGAKRNNGDECTGLDAFQHLLGRLNGKSEEVLETEKKAREDLKLNLYVERKLGTIRFVSGGWLVGDQLQEKPVEKTEPSSNSETEATASPAEEVEESKSASKRSKKRKAEESQEDDSKKRSKKDKKKHKAEAEADTDSVLSTSKDEKKKSKKRKAEIAKEDTESASPETAPEDNESPVPESKETKEERKERRAREKLEKKERKAKRKSEKGKEGSTSTDERETEPPASVSSTPSGSGYSTPVMGSARYLARQRFIAQKKMAFTDSAALNQIFMIKS